MKPWALLTLGVMACSTAVIFIKASETPPVWLAAERLLLAALILVPFAVHDARRTAWRPHELRHAVVPGVFLAIHFALWVLAARLIPAANSTLIANFQSVVMPVVALLLLRERASGRELTATAVGIGGVAVLALGDLDASPAYLRGDGLCFLAMLALAIYLALARRLRRGSLWLYVVPLYAIAGVLCAIAAIVLEGIPPFPSGAEALRVLGIAIVPTVIGHTLMNRAMGELRPQAVSVAALGNVPCAGIMAWILWHEVPTWPFWITGIACVVAVAMVMTPRRRTEDSVPTTSASPETALTAPKATSA